MTLINVNKRQKMSNDWHDEVVNQFKKSISNISLLLLNFV